MPTGSPAADALLRLELSDPPTLGGRRCGPLAVWFVALLASRARSKAGPRTVERQELRARLRTDGAYPMAVSRLFAAARAAGLEIGWGGLRSDASGGDPRHRPAGPYWLTAPVARRLVITDAGRTMDGAALRRWLQARGALAAASASAPASVATPDTVGPARFWYDLLLARQQAEEDGTATAAAASPSRRRPRAPALAALADGGTPLQRGWALFAQARQARRADELAAAREALQQALDALRDVAEPRSRALHRLCTLGLAWCAYQARDLAAAQRLLDRGFFDGAEGWRDNPRLCAEVLNLRGLLRRSRLAARWPRMPAADDVAAVFADFEAALVAAIEADAFTLMEGVASNLGYSIWLLRVVPRSARTEAGGDGHRLDAMRWILLSEWFRQRHALSGHSLWNVLSVCRIARGGLALANGDLPGDRDAPGGATLPLATVRRQLAPLGDLLIAGDERADWPAVTARLLHELNEAPSAHGRLETAAVMLEHLWQLATHGDGRGADALSRDLRLRLGGLAPADRVMFERELRRIDATLESAFSPPTTPGAPRTRSSRRRA